MDNNQSRFIIGLISENRESLASQLGLWHHLTLRNVLQRKISGWMYYKDDLGNYLQSKFHYAEKLEPVELKTWKFNEITSFCKIPVYDSINIESLHATGMEIEIQSVQMLRKSDKKFKGSSSDDMVQYLLSKILSAFSENFKSQDTESRQKIVKQVINILQSMPEEDQDELKDILKIKEFTPEMIHRAIYNHTLSMALLSLLTMGRYTLYLAAAKIAIAISGLASFYIARPLIISLLPVIMLFTSPFAVASIGVGLTWLTDSYTNKQIRSFLLPVMVVSSILASAQVDKTLVEQDLNHFINRYKLKYFSDH